MTLVISELLRRVRPGGLLIALLACGGDGPTEPANPDLLIVISAGNNQTGTVGVALASPVQVLVTDLFNQPTPGRVVNFVVLSGGGTASNTIMTDANGIATGTWQLGTIAGSPQVLEARVLTPAGLRKKVDFSAAAIAGAPDTIVVHSGAIVSGAAGTPVRVLPAVRLADQFGNPVPHHQVSFAVTGGGGTVQGGSALTDSLGIAVVGGWTLGPAEGAHTLSATAAGLAGGVTFQATATSPVPSQLTILTQPSATVTSGVLLTQQPVVQIANSSGDAIPQAGIQITASVATGPGAALTPVASVSTDVNGMATFSGLTLSGTIGSYTLAFTGPGLSPDTSTAITVAPGPATTLAINAGNSQSVNAGTTVPVAPAVIVTDAWGNGIANIAITFSLGSGNGGIAGAAQLTGGDGIATLGTWQLGPLSGPNSLVATATPAGLANDPVTFTATALGDFWTPVAVMTTPRKFTAYAVVLNLLFVAGGRDVSLGVQDIVEVYSSATNAWTPRVTMATPRSGAAGGSINGKLYVAGGSTTAGPMMTGEVFTPGTTPTWDPIANLPSERSFSAAAVINGLFYLAGGTSTGGQIGTTVFYDPVANSWTAGADLPAVRTDAVGVAYNGNMYLVGGQSGTSVDGALLAYDPQSGTWTPLASMPTPRTHANAEVVNGKIYVMGGQVAGGGVTAVVEVYNPATNIWSAAASLPAGRSAAASGVIDGIIYLAGGNGPGAVTGVVETYVP